MTKLKLKVGDKVRVKKTGKIFIIEEKSIILDWFNKKFGHYQESELQLIKDKKVKGVSKKPNMRVVKKDSDRLKELITYAYNFGKDGKEFWHLELVEREIKTLFNVEEPKKESKEIKKIREVNLITDAIQSEQIYNNNVLMSKINNLVEQVNKLSKDK